MTDLFIEQAPGGELTSPGKTLVLPVSNGSNQDYYIKLLNLYVALGVPRSGQMLNGKLTPSVSGNNLTLALKTSAGADPSADDPIYININGTVRKVTASTSCTLAAATNWFNAGGAELATKEIDYFGYAIWDSNSSVIAVAPARIPHGRLVSNFNSTTTHEKHLGNYANYTSTDEVANIGRFAATLSAGAGYTWTVPTYTNDNLIQEPIFKTRELDWTVVAGATAPFTYTSVTVTVAKYSLNYDKCTAWTRGTGTTGGTLSNTLLLSLPWQSRHIATANEVGFGSVTDAAPSSARAFVSAGAPDQLSVTKSDASNFAAGAGRVFNIQIGYSI